MENPGIDPGTSRMLSERSTIWANPPILVWSFIYFVYNIFLYRPDILKEDIKVFFVKYNDPIYVKLEKLDIMIRLATAGNIASVLAELKEYVFCLW